jgi:hypothetical protein
MWATHPVRLDDPLGAKKVRCTMLVKPRQTVMKDVIAGLQKTPVNDVLVHEPLTATDLAVLSREMNLLLRSCDYLSVIVVKHK